MEALTGSYQATPERSEPQEPMWGDSMAAQEITLRMGQNAGVPQMRLPPKMELETRRQGWKNMADNPPIPPAGSVQVCGRTRPLQHLKGLGSPRSVGWFEGAHVKPGLFGS